MHAQAEKHRGWMTPQVADHPILAESLAPHRGPNYGALSVLVHEWPRVALRVLQDPCEDTFVWNHGQARHAMMMNMPQKCGSMNWQAIYQTHAANQHATRFASSQVYPTPPRSCTTTYLPILFAREDSVEPILLDDEGMFSTPFDPAPLASLSLLVPDLGVAFIASDTFGRAVATAYFPFQT